MIICKNGQFVFYLCDRRVDCRVDPVWIAVCYLDKWPGKSFWQPLSLVFSFTKFELENNFNLKLA